MKRFGRVDENQKQIAKAIRDVGASVLFLASLGSGAPDILAGWKRINFLFEIKNPKKPKADQKLTELQERFHANWCGSVHVIETAEDALRIMGIISGSTADSE